jgi:DNA anti-recombination protein RmuC
VDEIGFGRREATQTSEDQRGQLLRALHELRDPLLEAITSDADLRKRQLSGLVEHLEGRGQRVAAEEQERFEGVRAELRSAQESSTALLAAQGLELREGLRQLRTEAASDRERAAASAQELAAATRNVRAALEEIDGVLSGWLEQADAKLAARRAHDAPETERTHVEIARALDALRSSVEEGSSRLGEAQTRERGALASVESALGSFQDDQSRRLERIRHAVEERLPTTFDQRLADSFRSASARLDDIRRVLDELRALAARPGSFPS